MFEFAIDIRTDVCYINITVNRTYVLRGDVMYGRTISKRYNNDFRSRIYHVLQNRRIIVAVGVVLIILGIIAILMSQNSDLANVEASTVKVKQYTSIEIQDGDTLWDLAEEYGKPYHDRREFIDEVKSINRLYGDQITAGGYLLVPVYR